MIGLAWLMSSHKTRIQPRIIFGGLLLQFVFAFIVLKTEPGRFLFAGLGEFVNQVLGFVDVGSRFMFEMDSEAPGSDGAEAPLDRTKQLVTSFAFGVLPTIIFFSSLMSVMYHLGIVQRVVDLLARIMRITLGTSGSETLSAAANIFVGQTEAPLVVRPYIASMTQSELMALMVGGFATIAGGVLAAYVGMGIDAGHLLSASVISAPAALLIAKVMHPETEQSKTLGHVEIDVPRKSANVIEAAAIGATDGLKLALNVAAMLIAFLALIAMADAAIGLAGRTTGYLLRYDDWQQWNWSLTASLGYAFAPLAWVMGVESKDCLHAGQLLGIKMVANEFVSYAQLSQWTQPGSEIELSPRSVLILTYALCGFANFSSIGIQLGGIGSIAPERRADLARLGFRAMLGGTLAAFMTACVAGILMEE
jgi:CNT family concentrative nucleoside transporter